MIYLIVAYGLSIHYLTNANIAYWFPTLVIHPVAMYIALKASDRITGGGSFRERVRAPFLTFTVANVFFWLTLYALHLYDPELSKLELSMQLQDAQQQLETGVGDPQAMNQLRQQINGIQTELDHPQPQPMGPYILYLALWNVLGFGLAALTVTIFKPDYQK
jgi:hypothetical protein